MSEALVARLGQLAVIVEATKGTKAAAAPGASNSKHRVMDMKWTPDVKIFERKPVSKHLSRFSHLVGQTLGKLSFKIEMRVTGATGVADNYGLLLTSCGCDEDIVAVTSVAYHPSSIQSEHTTCTMYAYFGSNGASSIRVGLRGAMGTVKMVGKVGEPLMLEFEFFGVHDRDEADLKPQTDSLDTITHDAGIPPVLCGVTATMNGYAAIWSSITIDLGNTVSARESVTAEEGCLHYVVTDRAVTGSLDPELVPVADQDFLGHLNVGTEMALSCAVVHTGVRTFTLAAPKCQVTGIDLSERNGIAVAGLKFACNGNSDAGDDAFTLTII